MEVQLLLLIHAIQPDPYLQSLENTIVAQTKTQP